VELVEALPAAICLRCHTQAQALDGRFVHLEAASIELANPRLTLPHLVYR
jgi:hypothetical protein